MNEVMKSMPRSFRREVAARRMIRMKVNDFYKQYCEQLRTRLKDPMADKDTLISLKELCALWHPDRVQEYFESRAHRWHCERNEVHGLNAELWWMCYLDWLENNDSDIDD